MLNSIQYIDPASTSALLYIVIALVATLIFYSRNFFYKLKNLIVGRGFVGAKDFEGIDIIFYSEGKQYWPVFYPIIKSLAAKGLPCAYLTSDKTDPGLAFQSELYKCKYIGNLAMTSVYLNKLKVKFLGMTTPQLDVMMLRRSKGVAHYAHIVHAPVDVFTYRKFAFDYFDSVFCSGPHQIKGIRALELKRETTRKLLLETGLTYFDTMLEDINKRPIPSKERPVVLVAPTWKGYSLLNRLGIAFFDELLKCNSYDVVLRPHPQSYTSFPHIMEAIETHFADHARFRIDRQPLATESMMLADLMISDLSGVFWDFAFLYDKPILLLKTEFDSVEGFEGSELDYQMWEIKERKHLGIEFEEKDIAGISDRVNSLINSPPGPGLEKLKQESVFNFGRAGAVAANQIVAILDELALRSNTIDN